MTLPKHTAGAPPHDVLTLTGGAIGQGLPVAVGAAIACPDRPVLALEADGSAMYTIQSLWTMAREELDVTVVSSTTLVRDPQRRAAARRRAQHRRTGARAAGPVQPRRSTSSPSPSGMGVPAVRAESADVFTKELRRAFEEPGPHLIEAIVPSDFTGLRLKALPYALTAIRRAPQSIAEALTRRLG